MNIRDVSLPAQGRCGRQFMLWPAKLRVLLLMSGRPCSVKCMKKEETDKADQNKEQKVSRLIFSSSLFLISELYALYTPISA